jgi:hypothetical protein
LNTMQKIFVFIIFFLVYLPAKANGIDLVNGRYNGDVLVFKLTTMQKKTIDHFRSCHLENFKTMNVYTPYVFILTPHQAKILKHKKGFSPRHFEVHETYLSDNDAGPHWNLALRFSEDEVEIPLDILLNDKKAKEEVDMQGWKSFNPCFPKIK